MNIFDSKNRAAVEAFTEIGYANPFLEERIQLEKFALGKHFKGAETVWSKKTDSNRDKSNIENFKKVVIPLIETAKESLKKSHSVKHQDKSLYEELILFVLYYSYRDSFKELLLEMMTQDFISRRVDFYDYFERDAKRFFDIKGCNFEVINELPHIFACFFQLTRAFYFIYENIVGESKATIQFRANIWQSIFTYDSRRYRRNLFKKMHNIPTLITGPSGTGKELVAQAIAYSSYIAFDQKSCKFEKNYFQNFHTLNLSTLSSSLLESEMFGHRKGSFTGALDEHKGYFEICHKSGSVFLDEIGEIDLRTQVKLLNLLNSRIFSKVGETKKLNFKGKIIAATNRDLEKEIKNGNFREDFYYRIRADKIETPSLYEQIKQHKDTLVSLVSFLAERIAGEEEAKSLARETIDYIDVMLPKNYSWPGNIRELEQCIRGIMVHGRYSPVKSVSTQTDNKITDAIESANISAEELLCHYAKIVYKKTGSFKATAKILDVDPRTAKNKVDAAI